MRQTILKVLIYFVYCVTCQFDYFMAHLLTTGSSDTRYKCTINVSYTCQPCQHLKNGSHRNTPKIHIPILEISHVLIRPSTSIFFFGSTKLLPEIELYTHHQSFSIDSKNFENIGPILPFFGYNLFKNDIYKNSEKEMINLFNRYEWTFFLFWKAVQLRGNSNSGKFAKFFKFWRFFGCNSQNIHIF